MCSPAHDRAVEAGAHQQLVVLVVAVGRAPGQLSHRVLARAILLGFGVLGEGVEGFGGGGAHDLNVAVKSGESKHAAIGRKPGREDLLIRCLDAVRGTEIVEPKRSGLRRFVCGTRVGLTGVSTWVANWWRPATTLVWSLKSAIGFKF